MNSSGADQDNEHFAGLEHDAESDTEHAQFRNYASAQGRWLAPDPYLGSYDFANPQTMNRYAYVLNNPLNFLDPLGLQLVEIGEGCYQNITDWSVSAGGTTDGGEDVGVVVCPGGTMPGCISSGTQGCIQMTNPVSLPTSALPSPGPITNPAPNKPSLLHIAACAVAAPVIGAAQASNRTVGVGVGGSAGAGFILGLFASAGVQIVADPQGNAGMAFNINAGGFGAGVGAQGGGQISVSTARNINALSGGPSGDFGGSDWIIGLDVSHTPGGPTTGTVTFGPAVGGKGAALTAGYTAIPVSTNCSDLIN